MINVNNKVIFISSDNYDKSSSLLDSLVEDNGREFEVCILTNLEDDLKFAEAYPMFDFMICNKPNEDKIPVEQRFNCALNFIKLNNITDYLLILDK